MQNSKVALVSFCFVLTAAIACSQNLNLSVESNFNGRASLKTIAGAQLTEICKWDLSKGYNSIEVLRNTNSSGVYFLYFYHKDAYQFKLTFLANPSDTLTLACKIAKPLTAGGNLYNFSELKFTGEFAAINRTLNLEAQNLESKRHRIENDHSTFYELMDCRKDNLQTIKKTEEYHSLKPEQQSVLRQQLLTGYDILCMQYAFLACLNDSIAIKEVLVNFQNILKNSRTDNLSAEKSIGYMYYALLLYSMKEHCNEFFNGSHAYFADTAQAAKFYFFLASAFKNDYSCVAYVLGYLDFSLFKNAYHTLLEIGVSDLENRTVDEACMERATYFKKKYAVLKPGTRLADIQFIDTSYQAVQLSQFKNKIIYLDVWSLGCSPCLKGLPELNNLMEQTDSADVLIANINIDVHRQAEWIAYVRKHNTPGLCLQLPKASLKKFKESFYVHRLPSYKLIDNELKLIDIFAPSPSNAATVINNLNQP